MSGAYETITVHTPAIYFEKNSVNYIKWRAKDLAGNGYIYSVDLPIEILPEKANNRPVPIITSPGPSDTFTDTETITFDGSTSRDPDNDELKFLWYSDIQGYLGTDPVLIKVLVVGSHKITMHVDDGVDNESIAINVQPRRGGNRENTRIGIGVKVGSHCFIACHGHGGRVGATRRAPAPAAERIP